MSFAILGLGTALPPHRVEQSRAVAAAKIICCRSAEQEAMLASLYQHSGIAARHSVLGNVADDVIDGTEHSGSVFLPSAAEEDGPSTAARMRTYAAEAPVLATLAAERALTQARIPADDITHLITVSCTGFGAPGVDGKLIDKLGLSRGVQRTHVGFMGCHAAINALRVAQAFADAGAGARVLLCCVELCSLHFHYRFDLKRNVANALFADGAAAVAGAAANDAQHWQLAATGSYLFPDSANAMTWTIGDHGFEMTLSTRVPALIAGGLRGWLEAWLACHGLALGDIGSWCVHPGGPRILDAVQDALALDGQATAVSRHVLEQFGNMSSPTVLFILDSLRKQSAPRPCVALAFGPGLIVEAALLR